MQAAENRKSKNPALLEANSSFISQFGHLKTKKITLLNQQHLLKFKSPLECMFLIRRAPEKNLSCQELRPRQLTRSQPLPREQSELLAKWLTVTLSITLRARTPSLTVLVESARSRWLQMRAWTLKVLWSSIEFTRTAILVTFNPTDTRQTHHSTLLSAKRRNQTLELIDYSQSDGVD